VSGWLATKKKGNDESSQIEKKLKKASSGSAQQQRIIIEFYTRTKLLCGGDVRELSVYVVTRYELVTWKVGSKCIHLVDQCGDSSKYADPVWRPGRVHRLGFNQIGQWSACMGSGIGAVLPHERLAANFNP
jgi:hypothetical protein